MMLLQFKNLTIRNADVHDAAQLALWWNDGKIMAHAGFPNGTGETADGIVENLAKNSDKTGRTLIVERCDTFLTEKVRRKIERTVKQHLQN